MSELYDHEFFAKKNVIGKLPRFHSNYSILIHADALQTARFLPFTRIAFSSNSLSIEVNQLNCHKTHEDFTPDTCLFIHLFLSKYIVVFFRKIFFLYAQENLLIYFYIICKKKNYTNAKNNFLCKTIYFNYYLFIYIIIIIVIFIFIIIVMIYNGPNEICYHRMRFKILAIVENS